MNTINNWLHQYISEGIESLNSFDYKPKQSYFGPAHRRRTEIYEIRNFCGTFFKEKKNDFSECRALGFYTAGRNINTPLTADRHNFFFPWKDYTKPFEEVISIGEGDGSSDVKVQLPIKYPAVNFL